MTENDEGVVHVFPHLSEVDDRSPLFTFSFPPDEAKAAEFGFVMFSVSFWIEMLALVILMLSIAACVGLVLYHTVIKRKHGGTTQALLVGWGLILPFWGTFSFLLISIVDIRNSLFKFMVGAVTIVCFFRTTECIYGFAPEYVTRSAKDFCFYYATIPVVARVRVDDKISDIEKKVGDPISCSTSKSMKHLSKFIGLLFLTGVLQSILLPHRDCAVFGMENGSKEVSWYATERYFTWELYANSALQALFFQMYLTTYFEALVFAFTFLTGCASEPVMDNPLLESQSPTEFWGKRWNLLVHTVLKNGVYKPIRRCTCSRTTALITTFISSGLFHEWILLTVFASSTGTTHQFQPIYGSATVFFLWQAMLIGFELTLGKSTFFQTLSSKLPRKIKTAFVVGMGVPLAHFFLEPYVRSEFFIHGAPGIPMIVRIR